MQDFLEAGVTQEIRIIKISDSLYRFYKNYLYKDIRVSKGKVLPSRSVYDELSNQEYDYFVEYLKKQKK
jgi:hypothetical protein